MAFHRDPKGFLARDAALRQKPPAAKRSPGESRWTASRCLRGPPARDCATLLASGSLRAITAIAGDGGRP